MSDPATRRLARRRIRSFVQRFEQPEAYRALVYHAAFPLILTPDLLYHLWANFQQDHTGQPLQVPWIAVADLLLSDLCRAVGQEQYEMDTTVRQMLLDQMQSDRRFGPDRLRDLAHFLLQYIRFIGLEETTGYGRQLAQAQRWAALAYLQPERLAHDLAQTFAETTTENAAELARLAAVTQSLSDSLLAYQPLLLYAEGMRSLARGQAEQAQDKFSRITPTDNKPLSIAGVTVRIPQVTIPGKNNAQLVSHVTLPPDCGVTPQTLVIKTWRVRNNGQSTWGTGYWLRLATPPARQGGLHFAKISLPLIPDIIEANIGDDIGLHFAEIPLPFTLPGQTADLSIEFTTPGEYGRYQTTFQLIQDKEPFGSELKLDLLVFAFATWPTDYRTINQQFGANPQHYAQFGLPGHEGIDIMAPQGSPVYAVAEGTVSQVGTDNRHQIYGNYLRITHPGGFETTYGHLQDVIVQLGQTVRAGDQVGWAGATGIATGPHLHLSLKHADAQYGNWPAGIIDPTPFLLPLLVWRRPVEPYIHGWVYTDSLQIQGELAQVMVAGSNLRQSPDVNGVTIGQIAAGTIVIVAGQPQGTYTPLQVTTTDLAGVDPTKPPPLSDTPTGWVLAASLNISADRALVGPAGAILHTDPKRQSDFVGFAAADTPMRVSGVTQSGYIPVMADMSALRPPLPPAASEVRIGLHASADLTISDAEIAEFAALQPTIIKILSFHDPRAVQRLAADHPHASWIVRVYLDFGERVISPAHFFQDTISDVGRILDVLRGRDVVLELHNEPNLTIEGFGTNWTDGAVFAEWWLELLRMYRSELPKVGYIFPGLSPGTAVTYMKADAVEFLKASRDAIAAADGLGLHLYWSNVYPMELALATLDDAIYRFPDKPIWISEASNNKGGTPAARKARQYIEFWQELHRRPNVQGVTYFIASASDPAFVEEVWVGRGIGRIVGQRPPSPLATGVQADTFIPEEPEENGAPDEPVPNIYAGPVKTYENFDLRISTGRDGVYDFEVLQSPVGEVDKIPHRIPLDEFEFRDLSVYLEKLWASKADERELGRQMQALLFPDRIWTLFRESYWRMKDQKSGLRLRLRIEAPELRSLPWEYVYDRDIGFLAHENPIVRYEPFVQNYPTLRLDSPLRILVATANPTDQMPSDIDQTAQLVQKALAPLIAAGVVQIDVMHHAQIDKLNDALRAERYHVLHFNGRFRMNLSDYNAEIVMENADGTSRFINVDLWQTMLQASDIRFVFLQACDLHPDGYESIHALAAKLLRAGLGGVLAVPFVIPEKSTLLLLHTVYQSLALGDPLDHAVTAYRRHADRAAGDPIYWGSPVLYMHTFSGDQK